MSNFFPFLAVLPITGYVFFIQGQEYTDSYMLEYKRLDGGPWIRFKDRKGNSVSGQSLRFILNSCQTSLKQIESRKRLE